MKKSLIFGIFLAVNIFFFGAFLNPNVSEAGFFSTITEKIFGTSLNEDRTISSGIKKFFGNIFSSTDSLSKKSQALLIVSPSAEETRRTEELRKKIQEGVEKQIADSNVGTTPPSTGATSGTSGSTGGTQGAASDSSNISRETIQDSGFITREELDSRLEATDRLFSVVGPTPEKLNSFLDSLVASPAKANLSGSLSFSELVSKLMDAGFRMTAPPTVPVSQTPGSVQTSPKMDLTPADQNITGVYRISGSDVLTSNTLGSGIVTSSLTQVGALSSGSISSGFGQIDIGTDIFNAGNASTTAFYTSGSFVVAGNATTTSSGNISTQGDLTVAGTATIGTLALSGNQAITGTLSVTGLTSLNGKASTTQFSVFDTLYVGGSSTTTINSTSVGFSGSSGSTNKWTTGIDTSDGGKFKISSSTALGTNDRFTINGSGNIGIGTSTPAARLSIKQSGASYSGGAHLTAAGSNATWGAVVKSNNSLNIGYASDPWSAGNFTDMMTVTPTGTFGLGTTTPVSITKLNLSGNGGEIGVGMAITDMDGDTDKKHWIVGNKAGSLNFATLNDSMTLGSLETRVTIVRGVDGLVGVMGIGTSTPNANLAIQQNSGNPAIEFGYDEIGANHWIAGVESGSLGGTFIIASTFDVASMAPNARLAIERGGDVGIGTTTPDFSLVVASSSEGNIFQLYDTDGNCRQDPDSGGITTTCSSDRRLKTDISEAKSVLPYITGIPIKDYTVIASGAKRTGVIAQELLENYSDLVIMGEDGYYGVSEISSWTIVKAIQELDQKIGNVSGGGLSYDYLKDNYIENIDRISSSGGKWNISSDGHVLASTLTVGSQDNPNGITLFDKTTKQPYCLYIDNGQSVTTSGRCQDVNWNDNSSVQSQQTSGADSDPENVTTEEIVSQSDGSVSGDESSDAENTDEVNLESQDVEDESDIVSIEAE